MLHLCVLPRWMRPCWDLRAESSEHCGVSQILPCSPCLGFKASGGRLAKAPQSPWGGTRPAVLERMWVTDGTSGTKAVFCFCSSL